MKKFKLDKAEVVDDLDLESVSELIRVRDRALEIVNELNREIAKKGLEEGLANAHVPAQRNRGGMPNMFMSDEAGVWDASMFKESVHSDKAIASGMAIVAGGVKVKSVRLDKDGVIRESRS